MRCRKPASGGGGAKAFYAGGRGTPLTDSREGPSGLLAVLVQSRGQEAKDECVRQGKWRLSKPWSHPESCS